MDAWTLGAQYDRTLVAATLYYNAMLINRDEPLKGPLYLPAFIVRDTRLFRRWDFVIASNDNGTEERCPVAGWSSKKRCRIPGLRADGWRGTELYMQHARWTPGQLRPQAAHRHYVEPPGVPLVRHENFSPLRLVALPDELTHAELADPAVRRCAVEALRAAYAACRVGTGSPVACEPSHT